MYKTSGSSAAAKFGVKLHPCLQCVRVKSGNFGHQVNSDILLQSVGLQMRRLLMSRLIRIFTGCLVNLMF